MDVGLLFLRPIDNNGLKHILIRIEILYMFMSCNTFSLCMKKLFQRAEIFSFFPSIKLT